MGDLWQELKFGARVLRRTPLLTVVAALSLALGVGANTTVFALVKAVFLETLPEVPGVERVALAAFAPLSFSGSYRVIPRGAQGRAGEDGVYVSNNSVTPDFFRTIGLDLDAVERLDQGRGPDPPPMRSC